MRGTMSVFLCAVACASLVLAAVAGAQTVIDASKYLDPKLPCSGLQKAIDAVPPDGGVVTIPPGRFVLKRSLWMKSNMTLAGSGPATVLTIPEKFPNSTLAENAAKDASAVVVKDAAGFEVGTQVVVQDDKNNTWDATLAIIKAIEGNKLTLDCPLVAEYQPARNGVVANIFPAIYGVGQSDFVIKDIQVVGPKAQPPFSRFIFDGIHLWNCKHAQITGCTVTGWHADGFGIQGGEDIRVLNNLSRDNVGFGFHPGTGLKSAVFSGNTATRNGTGGMYFCWDLRHIIVANNVFSENKGHGIRRIGDGRDEFNLVCNNVCVRNAEAGIHIGRKGWVNRRNVITGNVVLNNSQSKPGAFPGIFIETGTYCMITNNMVGDDQQNPTQLIGIQETGGSDFNVITGNLILGGQEGVVVEGKNTVVRDNVKQ